jgi:hypothetical protein
MAPFYFKRSKLARESIYDTPEVIGREGGSTVTNFGFQNLSPFKKQHIFRHHFESDGRKASSLTRSNLIFRGFNAWKYNFSAEKV